MKKLFSAIFLSLGVLFMAGAANYNSPSDDFVLIKGGSFTMGSPESEDWRSNDETQHHVQLLLFTWQSSKLLKKSGAKLQAKILQTSQEINCL